MSMPPPPGPPDVGELRELIDQWSTFAGELERKDYTFDLDNWRNDVDVRELILEALPMFSREEMGDHALKLDAADTAFRTNTRDFKRCVWGHGTQKQGKMDAARRTGGTSARRAARTRSWKTNWRRCARA